MSDTGTITATIDNTPGVVPVCWTEECVAGLVGQTVPVYAQMGYEHPLGVGTVTHAESDPDRAAVVLTVEGLPELGAARFDAERGMRSGVGFLLHNQDATEVYGHRAATKVTLRSLWPDNSVPLHVDAVARP